MEELHFISSTDIEDIKPILSRNGYELEKNLGEGSWGIAFSLKNKSDKILKITRDKSEFDSCTYLKGKELRNVYHIYRTFKLKQYNDIYFIEEEKLEKIDISELHNLINFMKSYHIYDGIHTKYFADKNMLLNKNDEFISAIIHNEKNSKGEDIKDDESSHDSLEQLVKKYGLTFVSIITLPCFLFGLDWEDYSFDLVHNEDDKTVNYLYDIINGLLELAENKISFGDIHYGNLMKRKDHLVIIDLGQSQSPITNNYDILENYFGFLISD